jgi:hypothetical protein
MFFDISEDPFLERFDASKDTAPELIFDQVAESCDHVEPTTAGRKVKMKALVARSTTRARAHTPPALLFASWPELLELGFSFAVPPIPQEHSEIINNSIYGAL